MPPATTTPRFSLGSRVAAGLFLGMIVFAGMSVYADFSKLLRLLTSYRWSSFAVALLLVSASYAIRFFRWHFYLRALEVFVPKGSNLLIFLSGLVMSISPGKLGELLKALLLRDSHGVPPSRSAPAVVAERLTDLIALVLLGALGAAAFPGGLFMTAGLAAVVAAGVVLLSWQSLGRWVLERLGRVSILARFVPSALKTYESLGVLTRPIPMTLGSMFGIVGWSLETLAVWTIARGLGATSFSWLDGTFAFCTSTLAGALAMLPGGLGVTDASLTGMLSSLGDGGFSATEATLVTLLVRLSTLWWGVFVGAVSYAVYLWRRNAESPG